MSKEVLYKIEVNQVQLELKVSLWNYIKYKLFRMEKDEAFKKFAEEIWKKASETSSKNIQEAILRNREFYIKYKKGSEIYSIE